MEQYRKILKNRLIILAIGAGVSVVTAVVSAIMTYLSLGDGGYSYTVTYLRYLQTGASVGVCLDLLIYIIKYARALRTEMRLKRIYICENDERNKLIMQKSGGYILIFCSYVIVISGIPLGYLDLNLFYAMFGCGVFLLLTKLVLKAYYSLKY